MHRIQASCNHTHTTREEMTYTTNHKKLTTCANEKTARNHSENNQKIEPGMNIEFAIACATQTIGKRTASLRTPHHCTARGMKRATAIRTQEHVCPTCRCTCDTRGTREMCTRWKQTMEKRTPTLTKDFPHFKQVDKMTKQKQDCKCTTNTSTCSDTWSSFQHQHLVVLQAPPPDRPPNTIINPPFRTNTWLPIRRPPSNTNTSTPGRPFQQQHLDAFPAPPGHPPNTTPGRPSNNKWWSFEHNTWSTLQHQRVVVRPTLFALALPTRTPDSPPNNNTKPPFQCPPGRLPTPTPGRPPQHPPVSSSQQHLVVRPTSTPRCPSSTSPVANPTTPPDRPSTAPGRRSNTNTWPSFNTNTWSRLPTPTPGRPPSTKLRRPSNTNTPSPAQQHRVVLPTPTRSPTQHQLPALTPGSSFQRRAWSSVQHQHVVLSMPTPGRPPNTNTKSPFQHQHLAALPTQPLVVRPTPTPTRLSNTVILPTHHKWLPQRLHSSSTT